MICHAEIGTTLRDGCRTALTTLRSEAPISLMPTAGEVTVVGSAAGPLNGDRLALTIDLAAGTELTVRAVAASLAWPGASPVPAQLTVEARLGEGAVLRWLPEPLVPVAGSNLRVVSRLDLAPGAAALWREEIVLGRFGEQPGDLSSRFEASVAGRVALRQELSVGPYATGSTGPAVASGARALGMLCLLGDAWRAAGLRPDSRHSPGSTDGAEAAALLLEHGGVQVSAVSATAPALRASLEHELDRLFQRSADAAAGERSGNEVAHR